METEKKPEEISPPNEEKKTELLEPIITSSPAGLKREPSDDEEDNDSCPATPVAGRRKRHRQWVWTLGPIEPTSTDKEGDEANIGEDEMEKS